VGYKDWLTFSTASKLYGFIKENDGTTKREILSDSAIFRGAFQKYIEFVYQ